MSVAWQRRVIHEETGTSEASSKWVGKTKYYSIGSKKWVGKTKYYSIGSKKWVGKRPFSIKIKEKSGGYVPTQLRRPWERW